MLELEVAFRKIRLWVCRTNRCIGGFGSGDEIAKMTAELPKLDLDLGWKRDGLVTWPN